MSHRTAGIQFPAETGSEKTKVDESSHNPGLGYLSTEMPTWKELPLSIPKQFNAHGSPHPTSDRDCAGSSVSRTS